MGQRGFNSNTHGVIKNMGKVFHSNFAINGAVRLESTQTYAFICLSKRCRHQTFVLLNDENRTEISHVSAHSYTARSVHVTYS